jgi:type II secretory pathway predicted ATPase ExeA
MYQRFFGLRELPFELTPNPKFLFLTPRHNEALSNLQYGVSSAKSLTVLVGEAGTGKTTLLRAVLESEENNRVQWVYLNNPLLTREDFVRTLAKRFALGPEAGRSKSAFVDGLERALAERRKRGETTVLVVDEAQSLSYELLEEIRLLANIETSTEKLLVVILAGQPEFAERLNEPGLRQLKQRVALRCEISPFQIAETAAYIGSRIRTAGGGAQLFTREAVMAIHEHARGIPRTINVICDNSLLGAFALGRPHVDREIVLEVVRDFDFRVAEAGDRRAVQQPAPVAVPTPAPPEREEVDNVTQVTPARPVRPRRFAFFGAARS